MIFIAGSFSSLSGLLAVSPDADYRPALFELLRDDPP
jgi:hypothetical protein